MGGDLHAEIAGAGFSGLAVATALARRGWSVRVHERSPEVREFGAGIWIWDNGVRVLDAIGAATEALDCATEALRYASWDRNGRLIDDVPFLPTGGTSRLFCISRQQLLQAIYNAALRAGVEVRTSTQVVGAGADGILRFESGESATADLVIGADGIRSKVRESLGLLRRRRVHPDGAIRLLVPHRPDEFSAEEKRTVREWWNGPRRVLYTPVDDAVFYLALIMLASDERGRRVPVDRDYWRRHFPHLGAIVDRVPDEGRFDVFETLKLRRWSAGRVALIGDAAHAMSPGLGQGCGTALVNALALAATLENAPDIESGLASWEWLQRPLTEHTQRWSTITWPLIRWPAWCARRYYDAPLLKRWILRQRQRPSEHVALGSRSLDFQL